MNELFVNIKVDREERPDIDQIYMNALHLLGEQGGWPLTMFLTPAGEPVWGGTYFPKEARFGRPAFNDILHEVARLFREEPTKIEQNRASLLARLAEKARPAGKVVIGLKELDGAARQVGNMFDPVNGGLRGAPKFPQPAILEMLWRAGVRSDDPRFFETVEHSLERMCEGGIYDHLGGGFSRYSVDERWLVPHFEKMLYDNAQLLELLALAWQRSGKPLFRRRARGDCGLAQARNDHRRGRLRRFARCRFGRRGGQVLCLVAEGDRARLWREDAEILRRHYDVSTAAISKATIFSTDSSRTATRTRHDEARLAPLRAKLCWRRGRGAGRPGSTTRCWPTGTA